MIECNLMSKDIKSWS